jgi:hypothetical protein
MKQQLAVATLLIALCQSIFATQADDAHITVSGHTAGVTPFINQLTLEADHTDTIKSIRFTVMPKSGSVTRPLSGLYDRSFMIVRGYLQEAATEIFLPIYGLYSGYTNTVTLTYTFLDGSSSEAETKITTAAFTDACGYQAPTVLQARTDNTALSYDFILVKGRCSDFSPEVIDTDGAVRWVGPAGIAASESIFFDNAFYIAHGSHLDRIDLDGTVTELPGYSGEVLRFHHNVDRGKEGFIVEIDSDQFYESIFMEVNAAGQVLKQWNMAEIIGAAMLAGGDDPSQFIYPSPTDWFHNNAVAYDRATDSLIVSSRENFVVSIDYETSAINWILGDTTKHWHDFPSLAKYALTLTPGSLPPIGQHAVSTAYDQGLLLFDNGFNSNFQEPSGILRTYSAARKYQLNIESNFATEVWNYERNQSVFSPICGSIYEDAPLNYLLDYAFVGGFEAPAQFAEILGLDADGNKIFHYQYPTTSCNTAFNSFPLHLEDTKFPAIQPRALNVSTRGLVGSGDQSLIGGFIVAGADSQQVLLRGLGPSLASSGLSGPVEDPVLTLYDGSGAVIATNDDWQDDPSAGEISAAGLAPQDPGEPATIQTLEPGAYTFVVTGKNGNSGIGLVEAYDLSPSLDSRLANLSTRGFVGTGDDVLIGGFILGEVEKNTVVIRALGPSLTSAGLAEPLADPTLAVYNKDGVAIANNDNWMDGPHSAQLKQNKLQPSDSAEAAAVLTLAAGAYTTVVTGAGDSTGIGLLEVYDLE